MKNRTFREARRGARVGYALACIPVLLLNGCIAMVAGTHQDIEFRSDLPNVEAHMESKSCHLPCTLNVRRQWASHHLEATQNGHVVAEGPVYRRTSYGIECDDAKVWKLLLPAFTDGLLIIPGIVDLSTGITEFFPETVVIQDGAYQLLDPCFDEPVPGGLR